MSTPCSQFLILASAVAVMVVNTSGQDASKISPTKKPQRNLTFRRRPQLHLAERRCEELSYILSWSLSGDQAVSLQVKRGNRKCDWRKEK
jgi:hypothetical protein